MKRESKLTSSFEPFISIHQSNLLLPVENASKIVAPACRSSTSTIEVNNRFSLGKEVYRLIQAVLLDVAEEVEDCLMSCVVDNVVD